MSIYEQERAGQIAFYETFLPRVNSALTIDEILGDSNDGVLKGKQLYQDPH